MNGTLHDLVNIHTYWKDDNIYSRIYFGGRLEAYATIITAELLGDLLYLLQNKKCNNINELLNDRNMIYERNGNEYIRIDNQYVLELAVVIAECYPRMEEFDWEDNRKSDIIDNIEAMISVLEKKKINLSKECVEAFIVSNGLYFPPKTRILDCSEFGEIDLLEEEMPILQYEAADDFIRAIENDMKTTLYCYECDNLVEIMIALLQSIAIKNTAIRKCKVCGRVFATQRRKDEKYCYRFSNEGLCKTTGKKTIRRQRMKTDYVGKRYNAINTNLANRVNATKIQGNKDEIARRRNILYTFRDSYQQKKLFMTDDELIEWMNEYLANAKDSNTTEYIT